MKSTYTRWRVYCRGFGRWGMTILMQKLSELLADIDREQPEEHHASAPSTASGDNINSTTVTHSDTSTVATPTTDGEAMAFAEKMTGGSVGVGSDAGSLSATPATREAGTADDADYGDTDTANGNNAHGGDASGGNADNGDGSGAHTGDSGKSPAGTETDPKTALGTVLGAVADAFPPAPEPPGKKEKVSPARRRAEAQKRVAVLRGMARTRRTALTAQREAKEPDADAIHQLEAELELVDKQLTDAEDELTELMERAARRADRDRDLRNLDKDPVTGKRWARDYVYDPRREEMQRLYAHKTHPVKVFEDGGKLIRADGGEYGREGGIVRALLDGAEKAGETLSPRLLCELTKAASWDLEERVYGMGSGYCRDAAWLLYLWCKVTDEALDLSTAPKRKLPPDYDKWVKEAFIPGYAEALAKLGLRQPCDAATETESTAVEVDGVDAANMEGR